ncbi:MAG TPA: VOC family protein, partial [Nocardioidaceae bacterium]|nr:VOC family protein [Nocardioidaceae bacterium]
MSDDRSDHAQGGAAYPRLLHTVLDTTRPRELAEFYRQLLGYEYQAGDEPPAPSEPDPKGTDWLVLVDRAHGGRLAFQQVDRVDASTWPDAHVPQQLHLDLSVATADEL